MRLHSIVLLVGFGFFELGIDDRRSMVVDGSVVVENMLALFEATCPNGWTDVSNSKRGYLLVVDPNSGSTAGTIVGSAMTSEQNPTHTHSIASNTFCINSAISSVASVSACVSGSCLYSSLKPLAANTICSAYAASFNSAASGYPFAQLRLCSVTASASASEVPANMVTYFDTTITTCPSGWSAYTAGLGRVLVPQTATLTPQASTSSALTSGQTFAHTHTTSTTGSFLVDTTNVASGGSVDVGNTATTTVTAAVTTANEGSASNGVGYIQLTACVSSTPASSPTYIPPVKGALLFSSVNSCPSDGNWVASTASYLNHLIVSLPVGADSQNTATWGGTALTPPNDVTHTHTTPELYLNMTASDWQENSNSNAISSPTTQQWRVSNPTPWPYSVNSYVATIPVPSFTSGPNSGGSIPYLALGLCRSVGTPTPAPSKSPTTPIPTKHPITSSPTKHPTTLAPTKHPSTLAPTTQIPTTSTPTLYPTTAAPTIVGATKSPSLEPTTSSPTAGLTSNPTSKAPTIATLNPTTKAPTPTSSHSSTTTPTMKPTSNSTEPATNFEVIIGGAVGGLLGAAGMSALIFVQCKKKKKDKAVLVDDSQTGKQWVSIPSQQQSQMMAPPMMTSMAAIQEKRPPSLMPNSIQNYSLGAGASYSLGAGGAGSGVPQEKMERIMTMYDFKGEVDTELSADANTELIGLAREGANGEWIVALNPNTTQIGLIPANYVKFL